MRHTVPIIKYPLDLSGSNPNNLVLQEFHEIGPEKGRAIAPDHGPFYVDSLIVTEQSTCRDLEPHVDYMVLQPYQEATRKTGKAISAVIYIHNKSVSNSVSIRYQVVGGEYSWSIWAIKQLITDLELDNRPVAWGDLVGRPTVFPPAPHLHPLSDTYGWEYIGFQLEDIARAILNGDVGAHEELMRLINIRFEDTEVLIDDVAEDLDKHNKDYNNPHRVTKAQVGLGLVENLRIATKAESEAGAVNTAYMTPQRTGEAIKVLAGLLIDPHIANKSNPHAVTKAQVGLGSVQNYPIATKAESEIGVSNVKYMTPLRTKEAVDELAGRLINAHTSNKSNPHAVTKAQVGLGNISNYSDLTPAQATSLGNLPNAGTYTEAYLRSTDYIAANKQFVITNINPHLNDKGNPHAVTKAQVGLGSVQNFGLASAVQAKAGTDHTTYMTPLRTKEAVDELAGRLINAHTSNKSNPHEVTKAQVGLGNLPNAKSDSRGHNDTNTLATSKAIYDHARSADHDARYVMVDAHRNGSIHWNNGRGYIWGDGAWRQIYPAQWS